MSLVRDYRSCRGITPGRLRALRTALAMGRQEITPLCSRITAAVDAPAVALSSARKDRCSETCNLDPRSHARTRPNGGSGRTDEAVPRLLDPRGAVHSPGRVGRVRLGSRLARDEQPGVAWRDAVPVLDVAEPARPSRARALGLARALELEVPVGPGGRDEGATALRGVASVPGRRGFVARVVDALGLRPALTSLDRW